MFQRNNHVAKIKCARNSSQACTECSEREQEPSRNARKRKSHGKQITLEKGNKELHKQTQHHQQQQKQQQQTRKDLKNASATKTL